MIINPYAFGGAPFSPADVAGLNFWLSANTLGLADNDPVASWTDVSGNGRNFTQGSAGLRPIFKTVIINGKSVVRFNGSSQYLSLSNTISQPMTVFVVMNGAGRLTDSAASRVLVDIAATAAFYVGGTGGTAVVGASDARNTWVVYASTLSSAHSGRLFLNGILDGGPTTVGNDAWGSTQYIGWDASSAYWNGDVAEIIAYSAELGTTDREAVENYLGAQYGITITH